MREFSLLNHIYAANARLSGRIAIPPGDDLAMVRLPAGKGGADRPGCDLLAGVDQLVAGRHVDLEVTPIELVGRKAIARSVSDIAAMAGRPVGSLAAVVLPPDFGESHATALFDAMRAAAEELGCPLIGGDIAFHSEASHPLVCAITVLAQPLPGGPVTRAGAEVGDTVYVTGALGGAHMPLASGRHLTFQPRVREAIVLAEALGPRLHAMIDISDGLGRDASHIASRSRVQITLDANCIPCASGVRDWRQALGDGEDYELCFCAAGDVPPLIGDVPITAVGEVLASPGDSSPRVLVRDGEQLVPGDELGWQHQS